MTFFSSDFSDEEVRHLLRAHIRLAFSRDSEIDDLQDDIAKLHETIRKLEDENKALKAKLNEYQCDLAAD